MAPPPSHSQAVLPAQNLVLDKIEHLDDRFLVHVHVQQAARCPECGKVSGSRHSMYFRRLKDLPWQGCAVELRLKARRFRCRNQGCARKIFAEPIPEVARSHARWTARVGEVIRLIGYTAGGLPGSRILDRLAIRISDTVIRAVKASSDVSASDPVRYLGVDDWAWRKGQSYGTILVDLDKRQVIDLLPDRSVEGLQTWLEKHPGVEVITRDRGGIYAEAAERGAANAVQVADRFHLFLNLSTAVERTLEERSRELRISDEVLEPELIPATPPVERKTTLVDQRKQQRHQRRQERYERVMDLHRRGYTQRAISAEVGMVCKTIRRWLRIGQFPERKPVTGRRSHVGEFDDYLRQRWNEGCHNSALLFREIRERGYKGSRQMVSSHTSPWRISPWPGLSHRKKLNRIAPKHAAILACRPTERLSEQQRTLFEQVAVNCPSIRSMRFLALDFREAITNNDRDGMLHWIRTAAQSGFGPLVRFAYGLRKDVNAVIAAVETSWSNGQTEGQINRLKAIKRQMYGRAGFHLLRARVLPYHAMAP
jgi:transposase